MKVCWRELIIEEMNTVDESWDDVIGCTLSAEQLDFRFNNSSGSNGEPFTLWTAERVYFPTRYDSTEWVESVWRHPCPGCFDGAPECPIHGKKRLITFHIGGG